MIYKACSRCKCIHPYNYKCTANTPVRNDDESKLRNKSKWHRKSEEIREASQYLCAICKEEGIYNYKKLEVHHILKLKERPDLLLDNYNLIALCNEHHRLADEGKIDKDYLFKLAKEREER